MIERLSIRKRHILKQCTYESHAHPLKGRSGAKEVQERAIKRHADRENESNIRLVEAQEEGNKDTGNDNVAQAQHGHFRAKNAVDEKITRKDH